MTSEFWRYFRLAIAISLVCVWAITGFVDTPVLSSMNTSLLLIAPFVQYTSAQWKQPVVWRTRESLPALLVIAAFLGAGYVLSQFVSDAAMREFRHGPIFILPMWALYTWALVLQATRVAASARAVVGSAHTDVGRRRSV